MTDPDPPRLSDAEYAEMAADYAANPLTPDDVIGPVEHSTPPRWDASGAPHRPG
ncbi:hypothetical protein [Tsukamurella soli]|uniref:Uncharacterized protein n=1 Tax=Tsukamurella soli TaxID=644556 RepID=A0ABP8JU17_9ACTN